MAAEQGNQFVEKYLTPLAVLLGAIIIAVAFAFGNPDSRPPTEGELPKAQEVDVSKVDVSNSPMMGNPDAPVAIAVWFDYQCPFCKRFELETMEQVFDEYVATGKIRVAYKDYQFLGPDSDTAAVFARAVWEAHPDRFHEWFIAIMTAQDEEHGGFGDLASITALTRTVAGIDTDRVLALMEQNRSVYEAAIAADRAEGSSFGINGTPGAIVGTTLIAGAQPYSVVREAIEAELSK